MLSRKIYLCLLIKVRVTRRDAMGRPAHPSVRAPAAHVSDAHMTSSGELAPGTVWSPVPFPGRVHAEAEPGRTASLRKESKSCLL